jgi:hypothetical protein
MKKMILIICLSAIAAGLCSVSLTWAEEQPVAEEKPLIQMAILLDTSGSMSGLIDQARAELWAVVNEFITAKKDGTAPEFQVALYEYGKSSIERDKGYIRMIIPFTTDLDKVSEELFALTTNGGDEYCGWVIKEAVESLQWSNSPEELKVIFIAGNEPFTQGPVDYHEACKTAISKGIVVNTIHCGPENEGVDGKWRDGALLADGRYLNIDHNRKTVHIDAPQDKEIAELGQKLNDTYIAYGTRGAVSSKRQREQDLNAQGISAEAAVQRVVSKSSLYYTNEAWDLVDALRDSQFDIKDVNTTDLPENMQTMTVEERKAYVETKAKERTEIQQKIQELNDQRKKYVAEEMKKQHNDTDTLGSAIIQAVSEQAERKNFRIESQ